MAFDLKDEILSLGARELRLDFTVENSKEVKDALKALGFKSKEIDKVLPGIYIANGSTQDVITEALRRLQNAKSIG